jgi:phosphoserine phosphatase
MLGEFAMPNAYDFDKTIVYPDSTEQFFYFCLRRHPALARYAPWQLAGLLRYTFEQRFSKTQAKAEFYRFLRGLPDWREEVRLFWQEPRMQPKPWFPAQMQPDDIIISASPEFLLRPVVCEQWGLRLVASRVDPLTGCTTGENCHGEEKVRRLREALGDVEIEAFYSDSLSDAPLARLAKQAYLVKGDERLPWPEN